MVVIYGVLTFIVSRFKSLAQTPQTIRRLILVLVCLLSITISYSVTLFQYCYQMRAERSEQAASTAPVEAADP
jgi:uncharacterized membrane protein